MPSCCCANIDSCGGGAPSFHACKPSMISVANCGSLFCVSYMLLMSLKPWSNLPEHCLGGIGLCASCPPAVFHIRTADRCALFPLEHIFAMGKMAWHLPGGLSTLMKWGVLHSPANRQPIHQCQNVRSKVLAFWPILLCFSSINKGMEQGYSQTVSWCAVDLHCIPRGSLEAYIVRGPHVV